MASRAAFFTKNRPTRGFVVSLGMANVLFAFFALFFVSACDPESYDPGEAETEAESAYPRKVIVHTAHNFGFATFLAGATGGKVFAEDPVLVAMVENGEHILDAEAFEERVLELGGHLEPDHAWVKLEVQVANGPYILLERGGSEWILERGVVAWW